MNEIDYLVKDINKADLDDICSCWNWLLIDQKTVIVISKIGDMFLVGNDGGINWLDTGRGKLNKVANDIEEFKQLLNEEANIDNWFLPDLVNQLVQNGKILTEKEVYSFKILPILGGEYSIKNLEPTDISVHFAMAGQIHERLKNLPEGTKIDSLKLNKG